MKLFAVTVELPSRDDARALADLIEELGYTAKISVRGIGRHHEGTPLKEWRCVKPLLDHMEPSRIYELADLAAVVAEAGFAEKTAAPLLSALVQEGLVERVGRGLYRKAGT